ncbi:WD40-repeat-containing domain protein [Suillus americanus]|nr:WD40-repeat-containing domain protein [Suillus americanus]
MPAVVPRQTMRGHTNRVKGVVHLPGERRIMTCSWDGTLRLWDVESGAQIGKDWRDEEEKKAGVCNMALSPNSKTVVGGSGDGSVRLWDVETGTAVAKWTGHTKDVLPVCWSMDGNRVLSGSRDGTARVWDVKSGETILEIETGHLYVYTVIYSPDNTQIATGGFKDGVKIWDAKTGELIATLKHYGLIVSSLAWTSDGKKLISASYSPIRIFDTATWQQIAILVGHKYWVNALSLSQNNRLLASSSDDQTARLWNLDTNLSVGPLLQHKDKVECVAFSADEKVLVTGSCDKNAYTWDIHAILKQASLEDLLTTGTNIKAPQGEPGTERTPRSSLSDKSFLEANATYCHDEYGGVDELSPRFFDGMEADNDSSPTGGAHPHSHAGPLLARLASLLHRLRPDNAEANEPPQPPTLSGMHPRVLFARLSSLIHHSPPENGAPNEPSTPSRLDLHALRARLSSLLPRYRLNTDEETESHPTTPLGSRPDALMDILSSLFRSQSHTNEEVELPRRPHVVEVSPMRDREVLFVAARPQATQPNGTIPGARPAYSLPVRLLAHLVLFICCASPQHADGNAQSAQQQQGQSQGPVQTQASTPTASDIHTTAPVTATAQPRPLPLRTHFVLFLCCASPPHADGH